MTGPTAGLLRQVKYFSVKIMIVLAVPNLLLLPSVVQTNRANSETVVDSPGIGHIVKWPSPHRNRVLLCPQRLH